MKKLTTVLIGVSLTLAIVCWTLALNGCSDSNASNSPAPLMHASAADVLMPDDGTVQTYPPEADGVYLTGVRLPTSQVSKIDHPEVISQVPPDQRQFYEDMRTVSLSRDSGVAGWLFEAVHKRNSDGYPIYTATCKFSDSGADCRLSDATAISEAYLAARVTLVRNVDVLRNDWNCHDVCVDVQGRVLGKVSPEMIQWRDKRCAWMDYGTAECP